VPDEHSPPEKHGSVGAHALPSFPAMGGEHAFIASSHVLVWQGSLVVQSIGVPTHEPLVHVSFVVQKSPSSHAMPSLITVGTQTLFTHEPMLHAPVRAAQSVWCKHGIGPPSDPPSEPPPPAPPWPDELLLLLVAVVPPPMPSAAPFAQPPSESAVRREKAARSGRRKLRSVRKVALGASVDESRGRGDAGRGIDVARREARLDA
jgi:hypothetical protein